MKNVSPAIQAVMLLLLVFLCGFKELHTVSITGSFILRAGENSFHWSFPWESLQRSCLVKTKKSPFSLSRAVQALR